VDSAWGLIGRNQGFDPADADPRGLPTLEPKGLFSNGGWGHLLGPQPVRGAGFHPIQLDVLTPLKGIPELGAPAVPAR